MYQSLALEMLRITEATALAAAAHTGRGDEAGAAQAAMQAMHAGLANAPVDARLAIGAGEQEMVECLYNGQLLGSGQGPRVDIAVAPLEGPSICANGALNALSILVVASPGAILSCPSVHMEKIAAGPGTGEFLDLDRSPRENLAELARFKGCSVEDLTVVMLYRPRHETLINEVREAGARIRLISDGDVAAALATTKSDSGIDILMGSGGAPQGILSAAALRCVGGSMQTRFKVVSQSEADQCRQAGIDDINRKYRIDELVSGDVLFVATGVTDGHYLRGIRSAAGNCQTSESVVLVSEDPTVRVVRSRHYN